MHSCENSYLNFYYLHDKKNLYNMNIINNIPYENKMFVLELFNIFLILKKKKQNYSMAKKQYLTFSFYKLSLFNSLYII